MEYLSTKETAEKWGVSMRYVQRLLHDHRIEGVKRYGNTCLIPKDAKKPENLRHEHRAIVPTFYTLPRECPEMMLSTLYHKPGSTEDIPTSLKGDEEAQTLWKAQLMTFQGKTQKAARMATELLERTKRSDIQIGCGFVICHAAMYEGNKTVWIKGRNTISEIPCSTTSQQDMVEFQLGCVDSALYEKDTLPLWFKQGEFEHLPPDCYPLARTIYLKWLLMMRREETLSLLCGPLIAQNRIEQAVLPEIYCRLISAVGYHDTDNMEAATKQIKEALALALPDHLLAPFAEMRSDLGILLDDVFAETNKSACAEMICLNKRLMKGWNILCQEIRDVHYGSAEFTPREHQVVKLAAKGLSNAEIAKQLNIKLNTVKTHIREAMDKSGAKDRSDFIAFVALDSEDHTINF